KEIQALRALDQRHQDGSGPHRRAAEPEIVVDELRRPIAGPGEATAQRLAGEPILRKRGSVLEVRRIQRHAPRIEDGWSLQRITAHRIITCRSPGRSMPASGSDAPAPSGPDQLDT